MRGLAPSLWFMFKCARSLPLSMSKCARTLMCACGNGVGSHYLPIFQCIDVLACFASTRVYCARRITCMARAIALAATHALAATDEGVCSHLQQPRVCCARTLNIAEGVRARRYTCNKRTSCSHSLTPNRRQCARNPCCTTWAEGARN